jgi:hypothetical protein
LQMRRLERRVMLGLGIDQIDRFGADVCRHDLRCGSESEASA